MPPPSAPFPVSGSATAAKPCQNMPRPPPGAPVDHLALIRQGVKLRKTEPVKQQPKARVQVTDPNSLTMAEILQTIAEIREAVANEDSAGYSSDEYETSSDW